MTTIALVSCVKKKGHLACEARDLYISPLFQGMREYAENYADEWYILSAKYGLVHPLEKIGCYNESLKDKTSEQRKLWCKAVLKQLKAAIAPITNYRKHKVILLAGQHYRLHLEMNLHKMGFTIEIPMEGMKLGEQLKWLKQQNHPQMEGFGILD